MEELGPSYVCPISEFMLLITVFNDFIDMKYVLYYMKKVILFFAYKNYQKDIF